jgi:hypothetical protein
MFIVLRWIAAKLGRFLLRRAKIALKNFVIVQGNIFVRSLLVAGVAALVGRGERAINVHSTRLDSREIEVGQGISEDYDSSLLAKGEI